MSEGRELPDIVHQWVEKAEQDLLTIDNNVASSEVPWDSVSFHAQQCVEST